MTVEECYSKFGGDYEEVLSRLIKDERIEKYLRKFKDSDDYDPILKALEKNDVKEAFRTAHTLKGISLNLGLIPLFDPSAKLSDYLRSEPSPIDDATVKPLLSEIKVAYDNIMTVINSFLGE